MTRPTPAARGGAKPRMIPGGSDLHVTIGSSRKAGIYELGMQGRLLARRVELPQWISDLWDRSRSTPLLKTVAAAATDYPKEEIGESRGHIFLRPPAELFSGPAVGLDLEIVELLRGPKAPETLQFVVYASGYRKAATWTVSVPAFLELARPVASSSSFMPQLMVPLSALRERVGM